MIVVKDEINETLTNTVKHIWESEKIFIIIQPIKRLQFNILNLFTSILFCFMPAPQNIWPGSKPR